MKFSEQLEQRFTEMSTHYPTKRSVLVPMLLYIQDEVGALTDEAIHEIAQRTEENSELCLQMEGPIRNAAIMAEIVSRSDDQCRPRDRD